jgi:hypothetical protein
MAARPAAQDLFACFVCRLGCHWPDEAEQQFVLIPTSLKAPSQEPNFNAALARVSNIPWTTDHLKHNSRRLTYI